MVPHQTGERNLYSALLKNAANFLEAQYGLTTGANLSYIPPPPDGGSIARHFAAYLALSNVTSWIYEFPDEKTREPVRVLITKPQKSDTVQGFRAITLRPWMKDVPELNKQFIKYLRNPSSFYFTEGFTVDPWFKQLQTGVASFQRMLENAGILAARADVSLQPSDDGQTDNRAAQFDLFAAYKNATTEPPAFRTGTELLSQTPA